MVNTVELENALRVPETHETPSLTTRLRRPISLTADGQLGTTGIAVPSPLQFDQSHIVRQRASWWLGILDGDLPRFHYVNGVLSVRVPPHPWVDVGGMVPHAASGSSRFPFKVLVLVTVGGDSVSLPDEPCPDILAVAGHGPDGAPILVIFLNHDVNVFAANPLDQCTLHPLSVFEPVAVSVLRQLVPFRRRQGQLTLSPARLRAARRRL